MEYREPIQEKRIVFDKYDAEALAFEVAGLENYRIAEQKKDKSHVDSAIANLEKAQLRLSDDARWCAVTYRIAKLYQWKGDKNMADFHTSQLKKSSIQACKGLAERL